MTWHRGAMTWRRRYAHTGAYEICATLLWYACFAFTAWVPFRDTAALAILATASRSRVRTGRLEPPL